MLSLNSFSRNSCNPARLGTLSLLPLRAVVNFFSMKYVFVSGPMVRCDALILASVHFLSLKSAVGDTKYDSSKKVSRKFFALIRIRWSVSEIGVNIYGRAMPDGPDSGGDSILGLLFTGPE